MSAFNHCTLRSDFPEKRFRFHLPNAILTIIITKGGEVCQLTENQKKKLGKVNHKKPTTPYYKTIRKRDLKLFNCVKKCLKSIKDNHTLVVNEKLNQK